MTRELSGKVVVFSVAVASLVLAMMQTARSGNLVTVYRWLSPIGYHGRVLDMSRDLPLAGAQIRLGEAVTYSDSQGLFRLFEKSFGEHAINFAPPYNFQEEGLQYDCAKEERKGRWSGRFSDCVVRFYPKAFEIARRVTQNEDNYLFREDDWIKNSQAEIWGYLYQAVQADWGGREKFVEVTWSKFLIDRRLSKLPTSSRVTAEGEFTPERPRSYRIDAAVPVYFVPVERVLQDFSTIEEKIFFVKDGPNWKWVPPDTRSELEAYVSRYRRPRP